MTHRLEAGTRHLIVAAVVAVELSLSLLSVRCGGGVAGKGAGVVSVAYGGSTSTSEVTKTNLYVIPIVLATHTLFYITIP